MFLDCDGDRIIAAIDCNGQKIIFQNDYGNDGEDSYIGAIQIPDKRVNVCYKVHL